MPGQMAVRMQGMQERQYLVINILVTAKPYLNLSDLTIMRLVQQVHGRMRCTE